MPKEKNNHNDKDINLKEMMNFISKNKFLSAILGSKIIKSAARRPLRTLGIAVAVGCISSLLLKTKKNKD